MKWKFEKAVKSEVKSKKFEYKKFENKYLKKLERN